MKKISFCSFYIKSVQKQIGSLVFFTKLTRIISWELFFFYLSGFLDLSHIQNRAFHTNQKFCWCETLFSWCAMDPKSHLNQKFCSQLFFLVSLVSGLLNVFLMGNIRINIFLIFCFVYKKVFATSFAESGKSVFSIRVW